MKTELQSFGPVPPIGMSVASTTVEAAFTWALGGVCALIVLFAIFFSVKRRSVVPLLCVIGAAGCVLVEPLANAQLQVWWGKGAMPTVYTAFGRELPLLILFADIAFFGFNALLFLYWISKPRSSAAFWCLYLIQVGVALALEPPGLHFDLWRYYGEQGIRFFGYPVWWPFVGGACCIVAGSVIHKLLPLLHGWRVLLVAPLVPMATAATYWAAGWPMFLAMNLEPPPWAIHAAALAAVGQAAVIVWICSVALFPSARAVAAGRS